MKKYIMKNKIYRNINYYKYVKLKKLLNKMKKKMKLNKSKST